ncbi:glycosyltransferase family 4 protein [Kibdelosporangium philippinense]
MQNALTAIEGRDLHLLIFSAECLSEGYGSATALRTFIDAALEYSSWRLTLVVPRSAQDGQANAASRVRVLSIPRLGIRNRRGQILGYAMLGSWRIMTESISKPNVVISWQPIPAGAMGALASKLYRVPHIVRTCGPELARQWSRFPLITLASKPLTKRLLRGADAVVIKSKLERALIDRYVIEQRAHLIPNAVGRQFFVTPRGHDDTTTRFLTVCQLESHKGVKKLIAAFATVTSKISKQCSLTIVGDGSQRSHLQRAALATNADIKFLGRVPHTRIPDLYASHDVFILPSVMEGCSNATLEAAAAGLAVIGTRTAVGDLVDDGVNGMLSRAADEPSLAEAIERFLALDSQRESMRAAARRTVEIHHPERLLRSYGELLASLC